MGLSEKCRKHPNHRQSPGVCSSCLREKLSKLSTCPSSLNTKKPNKTIVSHSSSLSETPPYSSASSSTTTRHRRNGSETYVSVGMVLNNNNSNNGLLKKSRSVSCANLSSRSKLGGNDVINEKYKIEDDGSNKKKSGFLKKLINTTSKKTKGVLMHSKTMKERSHSSANIVPTLHKS